MPQYWPMSNMTFFLSHCKPAQIRVHCNCIATQLLFRLLDEKYIMHAFNSFPISDGPIETSEMLWNGHFHPMQRCTSNQIYRIQLMSFTHSLSRFAKFCLEWCFPRARPFSHRNRTFNLVCIANRQLIFNSLFICHSLRELTKWKINSWKRCKAHIERQVPLPFSPALQPIRHKQSSTKAPHPPAQQNDWTSKLWLLRWVL